MIRCRVYKDTGDGWLTRYNAVKKMSECNLNSLNSSSKNGMIALVLMGIVGGGLLGGLLGSFITSSGINDTTITITVSSDFYLEIEAIVPLDETEYNCSGLVVGGQIFSNTFFDATMDWLSENTSRIFNASSIVDDLGMDEIQTGLHIEFVSDQFLTPASTEDCVLNGKTFPVSFGERSVLFLIAVGVYVGDSFEAYTFTFEEVNDFANAIDDDSANYTVFSNANFLRGENTMTINGMTIVEEGYLLGVETMLDVTFNGEDVLMPISILGFL